MKILKMLALEDIIAENELQLCKSVNTFSCVKIFDSQHMHVSEIDTKLDRKTICVMGSYYTKTYLYIGCEPSLVFA